MRNNSTNYFTLKLKYIFSGNYISGILLLFILSLSINKSSSQITLLSKETFNFSGADQTFTVPACVSKIKIKIWGAGGGGSFYNGQNAGAGAGGYVEGELAVNEGELFSIMVGEGGACDGTVDGVSYGFGGKYSSLNYGGFGGGLSGFFTGTAPVIQTDLSRGLLIAGGGGGSERDATNTNCTSGGQGGDVVFGGGMPDMQGEHGGVKIGGGGGGGYNGGLMTIRLSGNGTYHAGEGGISYIHPSVTNSVSLSSADFGNWNVFPAMYKEPPNITDPDYTAWVNQSNPGIGTGSMHTYYRGGHGRVVVELYGEIVPSVSLNPSTTSVCPATAVSFMPNSANSGTIGSWLWDFGDGSPLDSINLSPDHSYGLPGTYPVTLITFTAILACPDTVYDSITVFPTPYADFEAMDVCFKQPLYFYDSSTVSGGSITNWSWNFGDGSSLVPVQHPGNTYANSGTFSVTLIISSNNGCKDTISKNVVVHPLPVPQFSSVNVCVGNSIDFVNLSNINSSDTVQSYVWNFGDGSSLNNTQHPSYLFASDSTYNVQLKVVSNFGCSDSITKTITVNPAPNTSFTVDDTTGCALLCPSFQDLSSVNTGNIITWLWGFGDGSPASSSANPNHCYSNSSSPAFFTVSLTVTSDSGCVSTFTKNNYISVYPNPTAAFSTANVCYGNPVQFINLSTIPANDTIVSWAWNFGDGSSVDPNQFIPSGHLFTSAGNFNILLVATSNSGCLDSTIKIVTVNPNPFVSFFADDTAGCEPFCISFQNSSTVLSGNNIQWTWNIGDGSAAVNSQAFDHCYHNDSLYAAAVFNVTLTVTSDSGCVNTLSKNNYITVYPNPVAGFGVDPQATTINDPVFSITDLSAGVNFWDWNFGDGSDPLTWSLDTMPVFAPFSHTYPDTGTYTITLITSTPYNCADTAFQNVRIEPEFLFYIPNAFTPDDDGVNDSFTGKGIFIKEFEMTIFDRWGNLIYKTYDIDKPWDGKANRGQEVAQSDVYIYVVKVVDFKMGTHNYRGIVTLVR